MENAAIKLKTHFYQNFLEAPSFNLLTLRCKAIRGRILGLGAARLGLGGVWLLGGVRPHQTTPNPTKNLFARASPGTKQRAM